MTWEIIDQKITEKLVSLGFLKAEVVMPLEAAVQQWDRRFMLIPRSTEPSRNPDVNGALDVINVIDFVYRQRFQPTDRAETLREVMDTHVSMLMELLPVSFYRTEAGFNNLKFLSHTISLSGDNPRAIYVDSVIALEILDRWTIE